MVLDDLDRAILRTLQGDARLSHRALARAVGSTAPTVAARIRRMEELGIIQGYTVRLDPARFKDQSLGIDGPIDVGVEVQVDCHECGKATATPLTATLGGRRHVFCCGTCQASFAARHARFQSDSSAPHGG